MTCAWNPSGTCLASGSQDGTVTIWDPRAHRVGTPHRALITKAAQCKLCTNPCQKGFLCYLDHLGRQSPATLCTFGQRLGTDTHGYAEGGKAGKERWGAGPQRLPLRQIWQWPCRPARLQRALQLHPHRRCQELPAGASAHLSKPACSLCFLQCWRLGTPDGCPCKENLLCLPDQLLDQSMPCAKIQAGNNIMGTCSAEAAGAVSAKLLAEL